MRRNREKVKHLSDPVECIVRSEVRWGRPIQSQESTYTAMFGDVHVVRGDHQLGDCGIVPPKVPLAPVSQHARVVGS